MLDEVAQHPNQGRLGKALVGNDIGLYRHLLSTSSGSPRFLCVLEGPLHGNWILKAQAALDAGFTPVQVVDASLRTGAWSGPESEMWADRVNAFRELQTHDDSRIREVGRVGQEYAEKERQVAAERERHEAIHGG
ncbi:MAG TPA: hypothetical protein ENN87_09940 [Phycisphaerales bacterium]|nr:hypothetical protein [Phycisphaerales bacterium]